jgi:cysteine desulfurase/selenocysteine lyase
MSTPDFAALLDGVQLAELANRQPLRREPGLGDALTSSHSIASFVQDGTVERLARELFAEGERLLGERAPARSLHPAAFDPAALDLAALVPAAFDPAALDPAALDPAALQGDPGRVAAAADTFVSSGAATTRAAPALAAQAEAAPRAFGFLDFVRPLEAFGTLAGGKEAPQSASQFHEQGAAFATKPALAAFPGGTPVVAGVAPLTAPGELFSAVTVGTISPVLVDPSGAGPRGSAFRENGFDVQSVRRDFPILAERVNGKPLVWLDSAATTQKPRAVIDRLSHFYEHENSNVHRAAHTLAARATDAYEQSRQIVQRFLGARSPREIVFVRGATEGINFVANSWGRANLRQGDEIVLTHLEHHANIVPWQMLCSQTGAKLRVAPVNDAGELIVSEFERLLNRNTKLAAITHVSNALGTILPVAELTALAKSRGVRVLVDGAQSVSHMPVNVASLGCDFFVFSGHKVFGPTGIGVVFGSEEVLQQMPAWQGGGNMIADVTFERTVFQAAPERFEAGTGNIADAVGLGAALEYVQRLGMQRIAEYEHALLEYGLRALSQVPGLRLIGTAAERASVMSFVLSGFSTEEVGAALSREGIAVRAGHHCAQPILRRLGVETTVRPSLALYNTCEEIDVLVAALWRIVERRPATI